VSPPAVLVLVPSAEADKSMVQCGVIENPDNVARLIDSQTAPQAALLIINVAKASGTPEALLTDLCPEVADL